MNGKLQAVIEDATERRAERWHEAFGIEQTEIDALATLQPAVLVEIVEDALLAIYDITLRDRAAKVEEAWTQTAKRWQAEQIDSEALAQIRTEAEAKLKALRDQIAAISDGLRLAVGDRFTLPPIEPPDADTDQTLYGKPSISSRWPWVEQTCALIAHKNYLDGRAGR